MQRRSALKGMALTLGGLVSLPAWATGWTPNSIGAVATLSVDEEALLGEIVETIIPETTTPGAKSLDVHRFAMRMIRDCYGVSAQTTLQQGLALADATAQQSVGKAFMAADTPQRLSVLTAMTTSTDPAGKPFVDMIKRLTIQGYTNSEFYLVNVKKYVMAPGYYHGCVPVAKAAAEGGR